MKCSTSCAVALLFAFALPTSNRADDAVTWTVDEPLAVAPKVITTGSVVQAKRGWKFFSGDWKHVDGALRGGQRGDEKRGAQAVCVMPCDDAEFEFEVRLEGCRMVQFRLQDAIPEHICRVLITHDGISVQKDDHDHEGPDVDVSLERADLAIPDGVWKNVRVSLVGPRIEVTVDGKTIAGEHPLLAARKHFFEFIVSGSAASFRNLRARPLTSAVNTAPADLVGDDDAARPRPNIVLVLADDLGYGDLGCYGNAVVKTRHLDRFASQGLRLTACYSAGANCSPSRCGLMTGRTPYRVGIHNQIPFLSPMHLRAEETTIASLLRNAGYSTCHVGKWHLNGMFNLPGQPQPGDHGFDHWFSTQNNCLPSHHNPYNFVRNGIPVGPLEGYASQLVVAEAGAWLRDGRDKSKPFFLYVCFHEPHEPIRTEPRFAELYDFPDDPSRAAHHGNISQMDDAFGRLMAALDELGLTDDTLVWFTSDNGPERTKWHNTGSAGPLREYKGNVYEGGIRVPGIVRWPGHVKAATSDEPIVGTDFLPTICKLTGTPRPENRTLDGQDVSPLFAGGNLTREKPLYWQFNYTHTEPCLALRDGDWKIVARLSERPPRRAGVAEADIRVLKTARPTGFELYDLRNDVGERHDRAADEPERLRDMTEQLTDRFLEIQRETPLWPLFEDPRYEQQRIAWPPYTAKPITGARN